MGNYKKDTPRLTVKFIDADTERTILELKDRTWMTVGELLTDYTVDAVVKSELKDRKLPERLLVLVVSEYTLR
jgi:hypothetical protein